MKKYFPPLLVIILFAGLLLRIYQIDKWFLYSHDQDLLGWFIKDVVFSRDFRLIGQETSQHGVFIGPLFYYLAIPFYFLTGWDPLGGTILVTILSCFGIWSIWFVFTNVIGKFAGYSGAIIYAFSYALVLADREVVPTMPVVLWSVWFFYCLHLLLKGKQKIGWLLAGLLVGLVWHLNMGLILVSPLVLIAYILSRKKVSFVYLFRGLLVGFILILPFLLFEIRHGFIQANAILFSGTESSEMNQFDRLMQLLGKNVYRIFFAEIIDLKHLYALFTIFVVSILVSLKKVVSKKLTLLTWVWGLAFIVFFTFNPIVISEYYLNGLNIIWIAVVCSLLSLIYNSKFKLLSIILLIIFVFINLQRFSLHQVNESGYVERKEIIQEIKKDAAKNNYACVSISYITSPGSDLGYRYLTWRENLKTKPISDKIPVYTIVYPHTLVGKIDKGIGALGLIYPNYSAYELETIDKSCEGEDHNLNYPLFGYTK